MNPVIRISLVVGALLAVVIAGSYYYSRTLQKGGEVVSSAPEAPPTTEILLGEQIDQNLADGLAAIKDNRLEDARASLERVPNDDPGYLVALRRLADVQTSLGDFQGALASLDHLSSMQVDTADALQLSSHLQYRLGDYAGAELSILRAMEINDSDPALRYELGLFRVAQGRLPEAIATYDRAIERDPSRTSIMTALERLLALHEAHPELPTVHYVLAYFGKRMARPDLELEELQHFLAIESSGPPADVARQRLAELGAGQPG